MDEQAASALDRQAVEALKSLGKTIGQMALYKIGHPAVAVTLEQAESHLTQALAHASGELVFTVDGDKLIANGRIIGSLKDLPTTIAAVFRRFKLASLTFKSGVANKDLAAFCELTAARSGTADVAAPAKFLADRGVTKIALNEARYTKTDPGQPSSGGGRAGAAEGGAEVATILQQPSVDKTIQALIERAVPDAAQRAAVMAKVMELLQQDIERRIEEVTGDILREKNVLQNEQQRTSTVLSNLVEGVVMVDDEGKILMMNSAAEQLYGATLAEVAGLPLTAKAGEEHIITMSAELGTPADRPISKDVNVAGPEDARRTIKQAGAIVQNLDGKVVGMVTQLPNVAKQKELDRMKRDFVAHVTHELRAPLSSIRAALEILQGEVAGKIREEEQRMLQTAIKNSDRLGELINTILDFSKLESGQMTVFSKECDPEKIAKDGVDSLGAWAAKKRIGLSLVAVSGLPSVRADPARTVQVLVNLLSNAIKFTPVGGTITVRVGLPDDKAGGGRCARFSVSDTGPGIAKQDQKRIFDKFVQTDSGAAQGGGTGLGLTIAKALIEMQGGRLWVESESGQGSTFCFTLPVFTGKDTSPPSKKTARGAWWKRLMGR